MFFIPFKCPPTECRHYENDTENTEYTVSYIVSVDMLAAKMIFHDIIVHFYEPCLKNSHLKNVGMKKHMPNI